MSYPQDAVTQVIKLLFPNEDLATILTLLSKYGEQPYHNEIQRVHLAILKLSEGNLEKLKEYVNVAVTDYRDILYWADYPQPDTEELAKDLLEIKKIIEKFGEK